MDARKIDAFSRPKTDKMTFLRIVISLYLPIRALEPNCAEFTHMAPITLLFCQKMFAGKGLSQSARRNVDRMELYQSNIAPMRCGSANHGFRLP
jgi:hypothetical protein